MFTSLILFTDTFILIVKCVSCETISCKVIFYIVKDETILSVRVARCLFTFIERVGLEDKWCRLCGLSSDSDLKTLLLSL